MVGGAKAYSPGLGLLVRVEMFVASLSFLGGEAQRPFLNRCRRVLSAINPFHTIQHNNYKYAFNLLYRINKFLSPSRLFFLIFVPSTKGYEEEELYYGQNSNGSIYKVK